jgi:hypothetical protein
MTHRHLAVLIFFSLSNKFGKPEITMAPRAGATLGFSRLPKHQCSPLAGINIPFRA